MQKDTNKKIQNFHESIVHAIKDCDNRLPVAVVHKDLIEEYILQFTRAKIESLLWKYNELFESELNLEFELD